MRPSRRLPVGCSPVPDRPDLRPAPSALHGPRVLLGRLLVGACALALAACQGSLLAGREAGGAGAEGKGTAEAVDFWGRPVKDDPDGPTAPSFEPIVLPRPGGRTATGPVEAGSPDAREEVAVPPADEGWQEKWDLARSLVSAGEDAQALALIDACLGAAAPEPWGRRLRDLKTELRLRGAEEQVLRIEARPEKDVLPFRAPATFQLRLRNVSGRRLTFAPPGGSERPGDGAASGSAFVLDVRRIDRDVYASRLERSWTQTVPLLQPGDAPLVLAPGTWRDLPVRIPAEDAGPPLSGVRVLELSGLLRPAGLTLGGEPVAGPFRVRRGRLVVLPQGYEPVAEAPLESLERAVSLGAAPHVLVATEFLARRDAPQAAALLSRALTDGDPLLVMAAQGALGMLRERCVGDPLAPLAEPLAAALEARPERAADLIGGLRMLTDARLAGDPRLWHDWWRRTRETAPAVTAPAAEPVEPAPRGRAPR